MGNVRSRQRGSLRKMWKASTWTTLLRHCFLLIAAGTVVLPVVWVILMSFRTTFDLIRIPPTFVPRVWTLDNYRVLFIGEVGLMAFYFNSVVIAVVVVPIVVFVTCMAGYGFAKLEFPGRDGIFWALVSTIFLPLMFPRLFTIFEMTWTLGLIDTRLGLILPYLSMGIVPYTFIMRGIFMEIPNELEDAARIDGCSRFGVLVRIVLPLSASGAIMVAVLCFLGVWGEFLYAATLTYKHGTTLPVALALTTSEQYGDTVMTTLATAYVVAIIPPLAVYLGLNRWFRAGMSRGALKF